MDEPSRTLVTLTNEWKLRLGQAVLTAAIIVGAHCFLDLGKKSSSSSRSDVSFVPARVLLDENDPHKYNPNPSIHTEEYVAGSSTFR